MRSKFKKKSCSMIRNLNNKSHITFNLILNNLNFIINKKNKIKVILIINLCQ